MASKEQWSTIRLSKRLPSHAFTRLDRLKEMQKERLKLNCLSRCKKSFSFTFKQRNRVTCEHSNSCFFLETNKVIGVFAWQTSHDPHWSQFRQGALFWRSLDNQTDLQSTLAVCQKSVFAAFSSIGQTIASQAITIQQSSQSSSVHITSQFWLNGVSAIYFDLHLQ